MVATGGARMDAPTGPAGDTDRAGDRRPATAPEPLVADRSDRGFASFYEREHGRVLKHALWLVRDVAAAEDLTQDAFLAAHRRWAYVATLEWPVGWVQRVVSNRAVSRYRRAVRDVRLVSTLSRRRPVPVEVAEDRADLWDAVRRLPARQAQAVALVYGAGCTVAEAAAVLGCGTETVKTHLTRGRAALAVALGTDAGDAPEDDGGTT